MRIDGFKLQPIGSYPSPSAVSVSPMKIIQGVLAEVTVYGGPFDSGTTVEVDGSTIGTVTFVSPSEIRFQVTGGTVGFRDLSITNANGKPVISSGIIEVEVPSYKDLRTGGEALSVGIAPGDDVRHRVGFNVSRTAAGLVFDGVTTWEGWAKLEFLPWVRGANKQLRLVILPPVGQSMIGIGSTGTDETHASQHINGEVLAFIYPGGGGMTFWGLYGNNGTPGTTGNQASSVSANYTAYELWFNNDGEIGETFELFGLDSADPSDWGDRTNLITSFAIGGNLGGDEVNLMPFVTSYSAAQLTLVAARLQ